MRILTIETSTPLEEVALVEDGVVLASGMVEAGRGRGDALMGAISSVLLPVGGDVARLDAIGVSIGPGRFTGLRVGLATAKGLAVAFGTRLVPVPTLEALALSAGRPGELVCTMLDARRGEVYGALFRIAQGATRLLDDAATDPARLLTDVLEVSAGARVVLAGTGVDVYGDVIRKAAGGGERFSDSAVRTPRPLAIADIVQDGTESRAADLARLEPVYLRGR